MVLPPAKRLTYTPLSLKFNREVLKLYTVFTFFSPSLTCVWSFLYYLLWTHNLSCGCDFLFWIFCRLRMLNLENMAAFLLFFLECYHVSGHLNVLFRIRLLPRRDLVRIRFYFLFDLLTVFASSFLFLQRLQWLAAIQIVQHLYYFLFWEKTAPAKKVSVELS